jgi:polysaccharide biosynthesis transport protein
MSRGNPGDQPLPNLVPGAQQMPTGIPNGRYQGGPGMFAPSPFAIANPTNTPAPLGVRALPTIAELFHAFKRRWVLAMLVGLLIGTALAIAIWLLMPSGKHEARAAVQIGANIEGTGEKNNKLDAEDFDRKVETDKATMRGKQFLTKVLSEAPANGLAMVTNAPAERKELILDGILTIKRDPSEILNVIMTGDDKDQLRVLLDAFVKKFVAVAQDQESKLISRQLDVLKKSIEVLTVSIEKGERELKSRGDTYMTLAFKRAGVDAELKNKNTVLFKRKTERDEAKIALLNKEKQKQNPALIQVDPYEVSQAVDNNLIVQNKQIAHASAKQLLEEKRAKFNDDAPPLKKYFTAERIALEELEATRTEVAKGEAAKIRRQKIGFVDSEIAIADVAQAKTERESLTNQANNAAEINDILGPQKIEREKYKSEERRLNLLLGGEGSEKSSRYKVFQEAMVYENYNLKTKIGLSIGAAIFGLLAVSLIVSYLEWRNRRVDGVDQVVSELGMRVIGTIPAFPSRAALRSGEASQNQNWRFILNESVNSTRTMLLHTAKTQQMQVILVTSAMQGEGKTSLSSQLATSMATAGLRTLVLDCDLRNPSMQKLFDIPVAPGCAEVLLQEIDVSDAVQQTSVPNLWIIPAGQCNHRVIAALAQGHPLEALFNRLRGQFDIIIVDSCPILPVADTLLVAQHVDGVVFSILQDVSQLPKVQDASDRLVQLNIPLLGAVVNGITPDVQAYGYNYVKQLPA